MSALARGLKFIVIFNGILLIIGVTALFTALYFRDDDTNVTADDISVVLPVDHRLISMSHQDDTPHFLFETPDGYALYRLSSARTLEKVMELAQP